MLLESAYPDGNIFMDVLMDNSRISPSAADGDPPSCTYKSPTGYSFSLFLLVSGLFFNILYIIIYTWCTTYTTSLSLGLCMIPLASAFCGDYIRM